MNLKDGVRPLQSINKTLNLSPEVFHGRDAAAGIAAHEVGPCHSACARLCAAEDAEHLVPAANIGSNIGPWLIIASMFLGGATAAGGPGTVLAWVGVGLFAAATLFTLVTLPGGIRRFGAGKDDSLTARFISDGDENDAVKSVLNAAALTYVAAAISSVLMLLYWAYRAGLIGGRSND